MLTYADVCCAPAAPVIAAWVFYIVVFHSLSNLPIDKLKLFLGIHMRFWMQVSC